MLVVLFLAAVVPVAISFTKGFSAGWKSVDNKNARVEGVVNTVQILPKGMPMLEYHDSLYNNATQQMEGVNQCQVNVKSGMTFSAALRSILRQDPDIIMIGEIRDGETAKIAVRASITGHKVLSTIHTNNALNTIERLTDMEVERYLIGTSLNGVISQKLARRICPHCAKKRPAIDYEKKLIKANLVSSTMFFS